ncbi:MAG: tetratricopeptide repeat protein, partial [bacterium]
QDWRDPVVLWTKAVRLNPRNVRAYNNLGSAYFVKEMYPEALEVYEEAVLINPQFKQAYKNIGAVYFKMGDMEKSMKMMMKGGVFDNYDFGREEKPVIKEQKHPPAQSEGQQKIKRR